MRYKKWCLSLTLIVLVINAYIFTRYWGTQQDGRGSKQGYYVRDEGYNTSVINQLAIQKNSRSGAASSDPYNDTILIPGQEYLNIYFHDELSQLYHNYVNSLQILCRRVVRLGVLADGGWDVCGDYKYRPRENCLVYSFGIKDDFSFDEDCSTRYKCEVHSFDPSTGLKDHLHSKNVYFHNVGLSSKNNIVQVDGVNWRMRTLKAIMDEINHAEKTIDILKIDIEEWEWEVVPEMIKSGVLRHVRQLTLELHVVDVKTKTEPTKEKYISSLLTLKQLYDFGFRIFWKQSNLCCKFTPSKLKRQQVGCHNLSFKTIDILKIDIEEWEWEVVPEMIRSGVLRSVRQLLLELHIVNIKTNDEPTKEKYISSLVTLKQLYDLGFRIFWTRRNLWCKFTPSKSNQQRTGCHDLAFVNTQFYV